MDETIPPYWLARKSEWLDKKKQSTMKWSEAVFVYEAGEYVRIVKPGDVYDQLRILGERYDNGPDGAIDV